MNLDIDRVIGIFFSLKYELFYRLGLDGISVCFCSSTLSQSPSVPYRYINKLPISSLKYVHYAYILKENDKLFWIAGHLGLIY